jgi:leucyl-tRNA synthetase
LTLWTDRPEYIENAKFVALSHRSCLAEIENQNISDSFIKLNAKVINPFTNEELPIYLTNKGNQLYNTQFFVLLITCKDYNINSYK